MPAIAPTSVGNAPSGANARTAGSLGLRREKATRFSELNKCHLQDAMEGLSSDALLSIIEWMTSLGGSTTLTRKQLADAGKRDTGCGCGTRHDEEDGGGAMRGWDKRGGDTGDVMQGDLYNGDTYS
ncbi:hypothetical protein A0H81_14558 [Grifola frondosa]|uniref:Uncharacterized protein n=1 Tax=Grifola frondosa TaxID=5627 RepID=A0A1C7LLG0_GRIFR|nr:hypothetical protein A0H81_14558 [Grifola frondosa]